MTVSDDNMVKELRDAAERLVADRTDHGRTRRVRDSTTGYDEEGWKAFADLGWLAILVPEDDGGIGLGLPEMAAVVRALEKGLMTGPLLEISVLGARALVHARAGDGRSGLLAGIMDGSVRPVLALDTDDAFPSVTRNGDKMSGSCGAVHGISAATHLLVPIREGDELTLQILPIDAPGLSITVRRRADGLPVGRAELDNVAIETAVTTDDPALERALSDARIIAAAALTGLGEHMLDMTVEYLKVRKQFDKLIGSFQALQHKAVDLYIQKELSIAVVTAALEEAGRGDEALALAALRAKGRTSAASVRIAREAIQLHGAIGYTEEHDLGLYLKRTMALSAWLGNASAQRRAYIAKGLVFA